MRLEEIVYVSVQFSCSVMSDSLQPHGPQHGQPSLSITNSRSLLRLKSTESVMPSSHLILCCPLLLPLVPPSIRVFSNESTFHMRWPKYQNGLVGSPCSPRDSQEFSPMPQFKSINSLALSSLYGPTLTSIHDYWKNHSFE